MKYVIDLPDDYDERWIVVDMPFEVKRGISTYKRGKVLLEPYKPEPEPEKEAFEVGDQVTNSDSEEGYVLVPDCGNNIFVVLMEGYAFPQRQCKRDWKKTGGASSTIRKYLKLAYEALNEVKNES